MVKSPRYEATARIEVSPAGTNSMGLDELTSRVLGPSDPTIQLQSAVTVLQSNTIALGVMKQLRMAERKDFAGQWVQPPGTNSRRAVAGSARPSTASLPEEPEGRNRSQDRHHHRPIPREGP